MIGHSNTGKVRAQQTAAKTAIYSAAFVTFAVLVCIVGYIIFNGLVYRKADLSTALIKSEESVLMTGSQLFTVIAGEKLNIDELTYSQLKEIYSGENSYWGYITGQNLRISSFILDENSFIIQTAGYLNLENYDTDKNTLKKTSLEELLRDTGLAAGGIAIIPSEYSENLPENLKIIRIRPYSIAVNPGLTELIDGRRFKRIEPTDKMLTRLFADKDLRWSELGGPDVPVIPVILSDRSYPSADYLSELMGSSVFQAEMIRAENISELQNILNTTEGAVSLVTASDADYMKLELLETKFFKNKINLKPSFFVTPPSRAGAVGGISSIIINTIVMVIAVTVLAGIIGVGAAIYLVEYAKQGPLLNAFRVGTETLAGIPSIIFGLFGLVFFSQFLGLKTGLISGSLTLTLMILPTIIRTSEEALKSVPKDLKDGSIALGATRLETVLRVAIPTALPGILTGLILGIGRAIGETAAILFTMGSNMSLIKSLNSPIRVLSVHLYLLIRENISMENAFATATILVIIVFIVNFTTRKLIGKLARV